MRVILDDGSSIDLGETEATPTISLVDYSRRETDDFGVTTVVERGFARRMTAKLVIPFDQVDALQRTLAALRAKPVRWVADEGSAWLNFKGFYKDFEIDLNLPPVSYCTLAVEGLADTEPLSDDGSDPAPGGGASSLQLLQPATIDDAALIASSVPENDYPEWQGGPSYPVGARVIKAATHRIYESGSAANLGNDPAGASGKWSDIGPTNRWAMFDQALGSMTSGAGTIAVTLAAGTVNAVALLDVAAGAVRVQAPGYDRTAAPNASGTVTFLDMPATSGPVTVTVSGSGTVAVGTLLIGKLVPLGSTTESPKAGITDFSRKEADEFGEVIVVERAWAKRVSLTAMLRTDAIDQVANRIAAVRARPSLWIGKDGLESITAYGFFKDFQIERDTSVSKLSLSIEGLSTAGKVEPFTASAAWPDITDPLGTKPDDNADVTGENTSKDTNAVAGKPATEVVGQLDAQDARLTQLDADQAAAIVAISAAQQAIDGLEASSQADLAALRGDLTTIEQETADIQSAAAATRADVLANASAISSVSTSVGTQGAAISTLQTAQSGLSGSIATLSQTVAAGSPNMLANPTFVEGMAQWSFWPGNVPDITGYAAFFATWGSYFSTYDLSAGKTGLCWLDAAPVLVTPGHAYTASADFDCGGGETWIELLWLGSNGAEIDGTRTYGPHLSSPWFGSNAANRLHSKTTAVAPPGAARVLVRLVFTSTDTPMYGVNARQVKLESGSEVTSFSDDAAVRTHYEAISANGTQIASLTTEVSTLSSSVTTSAQAITSLEGSVASLGTQVQSQGSSISSLQTTSSTQAGDIATLKLNVSAGGANLLKNGSFEENSFDGWNAIGQNWAVLPVSPWGSYASAYYPPVADGQYYLMQSHQVPIEANDYYTFAADVAHFQDGGTGVHYLELLWYDASHNYISTAGGTGRSAGYNFDPTPAGRRALAVTSLAPGNAAYAAVQVVWRKDSGTVISYNVRQCKLERGRVASAYSAEASIVQSYQALSSQSGQLASLTTTVGTHDASINSQATAISGLSTNMASLTATVSSQGSSISSQATAISSLQGRTASLETRVSAGNPNLLKNGSFENGFSDWHVVSQPGGRQFNVLESGWGSYSGFYNDGPPLPSGIYFFDSALTPANENQTYTVTANADFAGANGAEWLRLEMLWMDANGNEISRAYGTTLYGGRWIGSGPANRQDLKLTAVSPPGTRNIIIRPVAYAGGAVVHLAWQQIKLEPGDVATPYSADASVTQQFSALSTLTTNYASLSSTVGVQGVTISSQQTAISNLSNGQTTLFARAATRLDVNGYVTGWETNNNGQSGDFTINADFFRILKPGGGARTEFSDGTWRVYDESGTLRVELGRLV